MMMEIKCPFCGSQSVKCDDRTSEDFEYPEGEGFSRYWNCKCDKGHEFMMSEVYKVVSRIVAKDDDDHYRLELEEMKEL